MIVREHANAAHSKLENFAPKILLCAQLAVLSVRNANIVSEGKASELGVLNFELGIILGFAYDFELFSCELEDIVLFLVFSFVGAWLRRDAIASYVCLVCLFITFITIYKEIYCFQQRI